MMSGIRWIWIPALWAATISIAVAQPGDRPFSVHGKVNFTTGSQLFPRPNSPDPLERASFFPIEDFFGLSIEVRYQIPETKIAIGLSTDYIRTTTDQSIAVSPEQRIPVVDGYRVIPVELTGYFLIPITGPTFGVYMGGGGGAYFGRRIYHLGGVEASSVDQGTGFGIHVLGGVSYRVTSWVLITGEMKFRDLQFETSNQFSTTRIVYNGTAVSVSNRPFTSRVHTDGIVFQFGAAVTF